MSSRTLSIVRTHDDREIPSAGRYEIDPAHTSVEFIARHLKITKVRGRISDVSGTITVAEMPTVSHVEARLQVASLDTGNPDRDEHLRSADFFDVDRFPTIDFRSTSVEADPSGSWALTGDLTIRDTTRQVSMLVEFDGASESPSGDERVAFSAAIDLDREQWGLTWNVALEAGGVLIGRVVRIELDVQAVAVSSTP